MRLVEIELDGDGSRRLGLHPLVTLVADDVVGPGATEAVGEVLAALSAGRVPARSCLLAGPDGLVSAAEYVAARAGSDHTGGAAGPDTVPGQLEDAPGDPEDAEVIHREAADARRAALAALAVARGDTGTDAGGDGDDDEDHGTVVVEIDELLSGLPAGDRAALAAAIATAEIPLSPPDGPVPYPRARGLAEAWRVLLERVEVTETRIRAEVGDPDELADRLEEAREVYHRARAAATRRPISPAEDERLGSLHEIVAGGGRRAALARRGSRRVADAAAELERLLDELGYPTWAAYRMGDGLTVVTPEAVREAERAHRELEALDERWRRFGELVSADPELIELLESLDEAHRQAHELLSAVGDRTVTLDDVTPDALDTVRVDPAEVPVDADDAHSHLEVVLEASGVPATPTATATAGLLEAAREWLEVLRDADAAAGHLLAQRDLPGDGDHETRHRWRAATRRLVELVHTRRRLWEQRHPVVPEPPADLPVLLDARGADPDAVIGRLGAAAGPDRPQLVVVVDGDDGRILDRVRRAVRRDGDAGAVDHVGWALVLGGDEESVAPGRP